MSKTLQFSWCKKILFIPVFFFLCKGIIAQPKLIVTTQTTITSLNQDGSDHKTMIDFSSGAIPYANLIESNGYLWSTTTKGGAYNNGIIFKIKTDGTEFSKVHEFDDTNGKSPQAALIESNGYLWGTTTKGGTSNNGTIFKIKTDGTGFTKIHEFDSTNGSSPHAALIESNGYFWGTTRYGGAYNYGTIFKIKTDGTGFTKIHEFDKITNGSSPQAALIESNGYFWGTTTYGGEHYKNGTIFKIKTNGTEFSKVHEFDKTNGQFPRSGLMESNGYLWGTTGRGGTSNKGTIFKIKTDGTEFSKIHDFDNTNGNNPYTALIESNGYLWGTTNSGGTSYGGTIFKIKTDGTEFTKIHDFDNNLDNPRVALMESNGYFWGTTYIGGSYGGTIFKIKTDGTGFAEVHEFYDPNGKDTQSAFIESNGYLWKTIRTGGTSTLGTIFKIKTDGTEFSKTHNFDNTNGGFPQSALIESNSYLWGTTTEGGTSYNGTIFKIKKDGTNFTKIHDFDNTNGKKPQSALIESNGYLWGTTTEGGTSSNGTIFKIKTDGTEFSKIHEFDDTNGKAPTSTLIESNGYLWGTTPEGGTSSNGTIFKIKTDGTEFSKIHDFDNTNGKTPQSTLIESNGYLWGTTQEGGTSSNGTIFKIKTDGTEFSKIHDFDDTNGKDPQATLIENNGYLWGATYYGGTSGIGTIFKIKKDGTEFTKIHDMDGTLGINPTAINFLKEIQELSFTLQDIGNYGDTINLSSNSNTNNPIVYTSSNTYSISITDSTAIATGVGDIIITATQAETDDEYDTSVQDTITISPIPVYITINDQNKYPENPNPIFTYSITPDLIRNDTLTGQAQRETGETLGQYTINQGTLTAGDNYAVTVNPGTLTIQDRPATTWTDAGWNNGLPTSDHQTFINSNNTIPTDFQTYELTIDNENLLTIDNNFKATLHGKLNQGGLGINGKLVLEATNETINLLDTLKQQGILEINPATTVNTNGKLVLTDGATLIHDHQNNINGSVQAYRVGNSAPLAYNFWAIPITDSTQAINVGGAHRYTYNETTSAWEANPTALLRGQGVIATGSDTVWVNGSPFADSVAISVTNSEPIAEDKGFNLIANPFLAPLDYNTFITENNTIESGALYFYMGNELGTGNYQTVNNLNPTNIASFQSFFVRVNNDDNIHFYKNQKATTGNDEFKRLNNPVESLLTLKVLSHNQKDQVQLAIGDFSDELDYGYDAQKLRGSQTTQIGFNYSSEVFSILAFDNKQQYQIPLALAFNNTAELTLNSNTKGYIITLFDTKTEQEYNFPITLEEPTAYQNSRYELHIKKVNQITAVDNTSSTLEYLIAENGYTLQNLEQGNYQITVYDITGRELFNQSGVINNNGVINNEWDLSNHQLIMVRIANNQYQVVKKIKLTEQ